MTFSSFGMEGPSKAPMLHGITPVGTPNNGVRPTVKDKTALTLRDHITQELFQQEQDGGSTIRLIGMGISVVPEADIKLLEPVERLSMRKNWISQLPANFSSLNGLRYLDLDSNFFREIPSVLMQCPKLEILDLSNNKIESLPQEVTALWSENLKVLSLKNNKVGSIWEMPALAKLDNLSVLEIEGNPLPKEELDLVQSHTPITANIAQEEYWAIALRRYLQSHSAPPSVGGINSNNVSHGADPKLSRAAKRMGFISTSSSLDHSASVSPSPVFQFFPSDGESLSISHNDTGATSNNELYNHSKFNDYFKRLSILPEESHQNAGRQGSNTSNGSEQYKLPHDELVIACRKLLFSFTECQQNIRKIASFCKDKSVAVSVVSLLYSVRSHIDNLVEVLEQAESKEDLHDRALIKLCITIVSTFKQIISQLRKNFRAFFEADDLCFIRVFYMTLICSYNEIYNAWCFIDAEDAKSGKKRLVSRSLSSSLAHPLPGANGAGSSGISLPRTRSNTLQSKVAPVSFSNSGTNNNVDSIHAGNKTASPVSGRVTPPYPVNMQQNNYQLTPPAAISSSSNNGNNGNNANSSNNGVVPVQLSSQLSTESRHQDHSPRQFFPHSPKPKATDGNSEPNSESPSASISATAKNVDHQLYQTLRVVVKMVNVVYDQLTSIISKTAHASSAGQQELTDHLLIKIRDLTDTCCQAMDLSKILSERLNLLTTETVTSEKYLTHSEKLKTWENINAFLKSIISILASTKVLMEDMPALNEIRPNLASLAKVTKDVTVVLDLSSYKGVSALGSQTPSQTPAQTPSQSQHQHEHQYPYYQYPVPHQHGHHYQYPQQHPHQHPYQHPYQYGHDEYMHIPMMTPQGTSAPSKNPFDEV